MITQIPITIDLQRLYGQKINLVQGENAGRRLAFTIVSGEVVVNLTGKILLLTGTKTDGSPVCLPITISSATTGQAYCDIVSGLVSVVGDATLQIRILTAALTGTATNGTDTSMYDTSKTWTANGYVGSWLYINSGTGAGQARRIISNTATQLVVSDAWGTNPAAGSGYSIVTEAGFSFPFIANVAASPNVDAAIASTGDFSVLTSAIATAYGLESRTVALETTDQDHAGRIAALETTDQDHAGRIAALETELNYADGVTSAIQTQLNTLGDPDEGGTLWKTSVIVTLAAVPQNVSGVFSVAVPEGVFAEKPIVAIANCASTAGLICNYRYDPSTATSLSFWYLKCDGALPSTGYRFSVIAGNN